MGSSELGTAQPQLVIIIFKYYLFTYYFNCFIAKLSSSSSSSPVEAEIALFPASPATHPPTKTKSNKIKQNQTKSNKIKQNQTKSNKNKQNQTKSNKIKQNQTKSN